MDITNTIQNSDASQLPSVIEWKKWQEEFLEGIEKKIMKNPNLLDSEMRNYISKARYQVYNKFRSPPTASIMSEYVGYAIRFFADLEQSVFKRRVDLKDYYHSMSELLAMYCDLRATALLQYTGRFDDIRHQFLHMLRQFLANNCDYITNALLRIQRLKVSRHLFENMFKFVEQNANFERTHTSCVSYCRYILFYRQWKKMYSDIMVLREISGRATERLKPPPNFRKHKLFEILRPKNSTIPPNLTLFFLTAAINTNMVVDKFFSIDIYEPEISAPDDLYEVVDLTDEVASPKREDESLEEQQSQSQVNRTSNRSNDDTYNLRLSFNNMMNMDKQTCNQQTNTDSQSTSSQCTPLSSYLHQPSWSPITRNLITNTNKDHQESIDTGIFSDRSSGNSPAYEMEVKDMNVITSTPSLSLSEKVITHVISSSCDKCGHKSSSPIVLPSTSSSQKIKTIEPSTPSLFQSKKVDIVILDEDVEQNDKELTQVVLESQLNCSKLEAIVPGDNDVIFVNNCDNNEESRIINIEEITPSSSRQTEKSDTSATPSELAQNVNVNIRKTNLKDVGVSTQDIMDSIDETHEQILSHSDDKLRNSDSANKIRVMSVVDVTLNTCVGNDGISKLQQASSSTNQSADAETFTIVTDQTQVMVKSQSICSQIETLVPGEESKVINIEKVPRLSGQIEKSTTSLTSSELTQNVNNVINNLSKETDNQAMNIKKTNLKDVSVSAQDIMVGTHETHEHVLNDSGDQLIKSPNKVRVMSVVDITPNTCVGADGISKLQQSASSTNLVTNVFHDAEIFTIDKSTHENVDEEEAENSTMVDIDNNNDEENIDTDMDTQHFVDQMFCSKPIKSISNEKNNKKQNIDRNTDISNDNDNINSDKSHCELTSYLKSPPEKDFFYGFSNNNNSGNSLLKSLSSNNNSLSSSASLLNMNNNNTDHSQCSIHLQNATRLTEEFVSTSRTRDQKISKKYTESFNKNTTSIKNNNTKSILKTSKKTHSVNSANNTSSKKKSVVLSNDSYTRYIHEDENQPIMKTGHGSNHRKQHSGASSSPLMQVFGQSKKQGSIIIAENHYDKPEDHIRRHSRSQDFSDYRLNSSHQHELQQERRVLRQRSESRDRDPYGQYRHPTCQEFRHQPKDRENGRYIPRRRCRSNSESQAHSYNSSTNESSSAKRARFEGLNENVRVTRSRSIERNRSFEDKTSNNITQNIREQGNARNRITRSRSIDRNRSFEDKTSNKKTQNSRGHSNARNRAKISSDEEKQLLYEKLRRKYNILKEVQIILNERNNSSLELYQKKLAEGKSPNSRNNRKTSKNQRIIVERNQRKNSERLNIERDSEELPKQSSNDHRKSRLRNRRNSNVNDTSIGQRRGRSRTRMKSDLIAINIHSTEKLNSNDRLTPTNTEPINNDNTTESMYPSTTYFSTPVRLTEFVECLQASTPTTSITTSKSDEIHVPSIQSSIERLQNSLASPISLPATAPEDTTDSILNDTNLNNKKFNSIKSGNLVKSNVAKRKLVNIFSDDSDNVQDDNVQFDNENEQNDNNNEQYEEYQETEQNFDVLSTDANVDRPVLRTKGARKLLKDEANRPIRQSRRSSSTNNRIFSTDTSSTRRLRKAEYLKTFRHVTGDIEEEQSTNVDDDTSSTLANDATTTNNTVTSTPTPASVSKLSWEHYINLSPEKQQVSIVDNNVDDDDESNPIYDELSTIVKSSDIEKPNDQHLKIKSVGEHEKSSISTDQQENSLRDNNEISYPATPMMNIAVLELFALSSNAESPIVSGGAELEQPIKDNTQLKQSNHHLDIISDNDTIHNSEQLESNKIPFDNIVNSSESISITNNMECTTTPIISPILSNNDSEKKEKAKSSRKVTFFEKTDNIGEILNSKSNEQKVKKINKKNRKIINNLSSTLNNKTINDDKVGIKVIELKNKNINDVKSNKSVNSKKRQIKQQTTSNNVTNNKSIKKELSSNVKKRRLLSFTTTPTMSITSSSVLVNSTAVSDDDDDISLAELKRRNAVLIKKELKNMNSKFNKRGIKSHKNCDINNVSGTSTNASGTSKSTGAIVLTLDEIETCDISVVSCEEVVGEGTILLNNANVMHKSSANTNNKPTTTTTTNNTKVNYVNGT